MRKSSAIAVSLIVLLSSAIALGFASAPAAAKPDTASSGPTFTNIPLILPNGSSEPAVSVSASGQVIFSGLSWELFQTNFWKGVFGTAPTFQGAPDAQINKGLGGEDADVDVGSTGTLHITTLMIFFNPTFNAAQLGVSAITCPNLDTSSNFAHCTKRILDRTQADRPWITSERKNVYLSYHDSGSSTTIHVFWSPDDGMTWIKVGDPIVGQGLATGDATFNNDQGRLVADPTTGAVFDVYAAGEPGIQKATSTAFNHIFVSRSTDHGLTWTASLVHTGRMFVGLNNVFPALAVDPVTGTLYAAWSDAHNVTVAFSKDHGVTWSAAVTVNTGNAATAVFPALAAYNGQADLAYYATAASSKDDPSAVWNTYMATSTDGTHWSQARVTSQPNHVGVICTQGIACARGTRNLLDLFEVAIDPQNGMAALIYTDDTLTTLPGTTTPLPQVAAAFQTS